MDLGKAHHRVYREVMWSVLLLCGEVLNLLKEEYIFSPIYLVNNLYVLNEYFREHCYLISNEFIMEVTKFCNHNRKAH